MDFGGLMTLKATNAVLNFNPSAGQDLATFASLSATFPGLANLNGTAKNFAIGADGKIKTLAGFGVDVNASSDALKWPSWLPIHITQLSISWTNFNVYPGNFKIILSASVTGLKGLPVTVGGSVTGLTIDIGLLKQGKLPITDLGSASITISGNLFGGTVNGTIFLGLMKTDAAGNRIVPGDNTTVVPDRVFSPAIISCLP